MSYCLYLTADRIGKESGGGKVTYHELEAMRRLVQLEQELIKEVIPVSIDHSLAKDPFEQDLEIRDRVQGIITAKDQAPVLAHCYAGCLTETVDYLKHLNVPVTYTAAAHDVDKSATEFGLLGIPYNFPHLTESSLWKKYVRGYLRSDCLVVPSLHSQHFMRRTAEDYEYQTPIEVIPHGISPVWNSSGGMAESYPTQFVVGYLGAIGPDKGLRYLLEGWKRARLDGELVIAGSQSQSEFVTFLIRLFADSVRVQQIGWVKNLGDFYTKISVYVQPSVTEGFGIEVLEAMQYGRPVICSLGAGAVDCVHRDWTYPPHDTYALAELLKKAYTLHKTQTEEQRRKSISQRLCQAEQYLWNSYIYNHYVRLWRRYL